MSNDIKFAYVNKHFRIKAEKSNMMRPFIHFHASYFSSRFYQVRSYLKAAQKLPVKIEVSLPRNEGKSKNFFILRFFFLSNYTWYNDPIKVYLKMQTYHHWLRSFFCTIVLKVNHIWCWLMWHFFSNASSFFPSRI